MKWRLLISGANLIFVSSHISSDMCEKSVLYSILRTQHRPMCTTVYCAAPRHIQKTNLKKADWDEVSTEFDSAIEEVILPHMQVMWTNGTEQSYTIA